MLEYYIDLGGRLFIGTSSKMRNILGMTPSLEEYTLVERTPPLLKIILVSDIILGNNILFLTQEGRIGYLIDGVNYLDFENIKDIAGRADILIMHSNNGMARELNLTTGNIVTLMCDVKKISDYGMNRIIIITNDGQVYMIDEFGLTPLDRETTDKYENGLFFNEEKISSNLTTPRELLRQDFLSVVYYGSRVIPSTDGILAITLNREIKFYIGEDCHEITTEVIPNRFLSISNNFRVLEDVNGNLYWYYLTDMTKLKLNKIDDIPRLIEQAGIAFRTSKLKAAR